MTAEGVPADGGDISLYLDGTSTATSYVHCCIIVPDVIWNETGICKTLVR